MQPDLMSHESNQFLSELSTFDLGIHMNDYNLAGQPHYSNEDVTVHFLDLSCIHFQPVNLNLIRLSLLLLDLR